MLLGYRVSQKSILWPLVAVMLPGWLLLVALVRRPNTDYHTQMALHSRVAQQMLAYDHAETLEGREGGADSLPYRRAIIETLYRQAEQAGLIKDAQSADEALVWLRLGDAKRAAEKLEGVTPDKAVAPYFNLVQKTLQSQVLNDEDKTTLSKLLADNPGDWWLQTLAVRHHLADTVDPSLQQRAFAELRAADLLLPCLGVLALLLAFPAWRILYSTWSIWPYSERLQRLWPVPLMLFIISLRGLSLLLGSKVSTLLLPMISWAGQRDPLTVYHINVCLGFFFNMLLLTATTYGVKEAVAPRWGTLGEVLGFDWKEFRNPRLWLMAFPCAVGLIYGLAPLPGLLDQWQLGGPSLYDGLSRSPAGYGTLGTLLSLVQAIIVAPVFEEIIYRGFLLSALRNRLGPVLGILSSSLIFALAHGASFSGTVTAFVFGLAYAGIKLHTGRLSTAMVLHACVAVIQMAFALLHGG